MIFSFGIHLVKTNVIIGFLLKYYGNIQHICYQMSIKLIEIVLSIRFGGISLIFPPASRSKIDYYSIGNMNSPNFILHCKQKIG